MLGAERDSLRCNSGKIKSRGLDRAIYPPYNVGRAVASEREDSPLGVQRCVPLLGGFSMPSFGHVNLGVDTTTIRSYNGAFAY